MLKGRFTFITQLDRKEITWKSKSDQNKSFDSKQSVENLNNNILSINIFEQLSTSR